MIGTERRFELMKATGKYSRLTIATDRVTVKVKEGDDTQRLVNLAKKIENQINIPYTLRGVFKEKGVTLYRGKKEEQLERFVFDATGTFVKTIDKKERNGSN